MAVPAAQSPHIPARSAGAAADWARAAGARARAVRCAHALLRRALLHQVHIDQPQGLELPPVLLDLLRTTSLRLQLLCHQHLLTGCEHLLPLARRVARAGRRFLGRRGSARAARAGVARHLDLLFSRSTFGDTALNRNVAPCWQPVTYLGSQSAARAHRWPPWRLSSASCAR